MPNKSGKGKSYKNDDEDLEDLNTSRKTNNTSNISGDKKFANKKRGRNDKGKKGKLNMEYEYEDKNKAGQQYNLDWQIENISKIN